MRHKKITALVLSFLLVMSLGTTAFAANSTTAIVPVTLTVANEYRAVNVTIPASLPVHVVNDAVVVATNTAITNNSKTTAIQVVSVQVTDAAYRIGSFRSFSGSKRIALEINGCGTEGAGLLSLSANAFPKLPALGTLPLDYQAKVSSDAPNAANVNAANVVFTISIVD